MDQPIQLDGLLTGAAVQPVNRRAAAISASRSASIWRAVHRIGSPPAVQTPRARAVPVQHPPAVLALQQVRRIGFGLARRDAFAGLSLTIVQRISGPAIRHRPSRPGTGHQPLIARPW